MVDRECPSIRVETVGAGLSVVGVANQDLWAFTETLPFGVATDIHCCLAAARTDVLDLFKALGECQEHR